MTNKAWIIVDQEKIGARNQCLGLAAALNLEPCLKLVSVKSIYGYVPSFLWPRSLKVLSASSLDELTDSCLPQMFIASGRKALVPAIVLKRQSPSIPLILLQKPSVFKREPDVILLPRHDRYCGHNVLTVTGNLHRITPLVLAEAVSQHEDILQRVANKYVVTILIGGPNRSFSFPILEIHGMIKSLLQELEARQDFFYLVSLSRRTPDAVQRQFLGVNHPRVYVWDGQGPNPYFAFLGLADAFVITGDSVAMISEAAVTGKPIHIFYLPGKSEKFKLFYNDLKLRGMIRPLAFPLAVWKYKPFNEAGEVAKKIKAKLKF